MPGADTNKDDDVLEEAKEAFQRAEDAESENRAEALEDIRFARLGEQWPEKIRAARELEGRPCLTINRLPGFIRQVVNDARQNKPAIAVHPVDSGSDPETAEVYSGLIRHVEQSSDAEVAYDTALDFAVTGGFGYFRINTRYASDDTFEQDIVIERVANPFAVYGDPESTAADSSDWNSAFVLDGMPKRVFERRWKGCDAVSFDGAGGSMMGPTSEDRVQIAEHWSREEVGRKIVALSVPTNADPHPEAIEQWHALVGDGMVIGLDVYEANKDLFDHVGSQVVGRPREVLSYKVTQRLLSGAEVLETVDWAGKYIPIVPVYGDEVLIEGRRVLRSLVRDARDPQRMFNYWRTTTTELVALAPKAPFIGPTGAFTTDADKWATANTQAHAYLEYDPVPEAGNTPPQRQPFAGVPAGALQEALNAADDLKAVTGMYDASLGARSNETSGRAIMARQREGDVSTFHYIDNLSRAIRHGGRILVDLIPKVYNTPRMVRILGPDGDAKAINVAPKDDAQGSENENNAEAMAPKAATMTEGQDQAQKLERVFDLGVGNYDVTVSAGPSFTSRREEAATQMVELIRAYPAAAPILGDLLAKNLDWPGADEIAERLKALLPAQLQGQNPEIEAAKAQIGQLAQALGQAKAEIMGLKQDRENESRKVDVDAFNAETNRLKAIVGKDGAPYDMAQMGALVTSSLVQILQSPDILEAAANGAPPEAIQAMIAQRMKPPGEPEGGAPPPALAA